MVSTSKGAKFSEKQLDLLRLLKEKPYLQNELQAVMDFTAPNLHYHLQKLEEEDLIVKNVLQQMGNAKINKISLNPSNMQKIRDILEIKVENMTLITGFGSLDTGYRLPDLVLAELTKEYHKITRIVCFSTPDAIEKRNQFFESENLCSIDRIIPYDYVDYRYYGSAFFQTVQEVINSELATANIILDLTPLSKLYTLKLLEMANRFHLPCIYLGMDETGKNQLMWMTEMKISGVFPKN